MQPLKEQITALLEALELNFEFDEENNLFRLNFETENAPVRFMSVFHMTMNGS